MVSSRPTPRGARRLSPGEARGSTRKAGRSGPGWGRVPARGPRRLRGSAGLCWATLLKRVFAVDVLRCPGCGGRRRIVGVYSGGPRLPELLERLGLGDRSTRPPPGAAG
jgi:hypothetical protein